MLLFCVIRTTLALHFYLQSILKETSPGISLEGMMLKLKLQYFGHLMRSRLIGKDSDAGRDWGQEEKGTTEGEMAGWHHWPNGRESEWTPGVGDGQGGLACCDSWCLKESDTTERLNWTELNWTLIKEAPERPLTTTPHHGGGSEKTAVDEPGRWVHQTLNPWHLDLELLSLRTVRNISLLFTSCPMVLWCSSPNWVWHDPLDFIT